MTPPAFCGECVRESDDLKPWVERSKGVTRASRVVWKCKACGEKPSIVELLRRAEERRR